MKRDLGLLVELNSVSKVFGTQTILSSINARIAAGEFVSIVGPSGCGKSTLLNLMAGLDSSNSGEVKVGDQVLGILKPHQRDVFRLQNIAFVYQFFHLLPTLTVWENASLAAFEKAKSVGSDLQNVKSRASELLSRLGLGQALHKKPSELSGGMMARAGLARALTLSPRLLLADEPTGSVDSATGDTVLKILQEEQRLQGFTLVLVTHDQKAAALADRQIEMKDGRILG